MTPSGRFPALAALLVAALLPAARPVLAALGAAELYGPLLNPATWSLSVSPDGTFAAILDRRHLMIHHVPSEQQLPVATSGGVLRLMWDGDHTLLVESLASEYEGTAGERSEKIINRSYDFSLQEGEIHVETALLERPGRIVDPLPERENAILFAPEAERGSVYLVAPTELARIPAFGFSPFRGQNRVARLSGSDLLGVDWFADHRGQVRAALTLSGRAGGERTLELQVRDSADAPWRVLSAAAWDEFDLFPMGFAEDDQQLLVATNRGRDTYGLYELDPATGSVGRLRYAHPSAELVGVEFDYSGRNLLGVDYFEGGIRRTHFLESGLQRHLEAIERRFPGEVVQIVGMSRDERLFGVFVSSAVNPGAYFTIAPEAKRGHAMGMVAPLLAPDRLVPSRVFRVRSKDGVEVEAIYTDRGGRPRPLVVVPHGGPIGVHDETLFDPLVQFIAGRYFAVLQVNYRGSSGYGRSFERGGWREWGGAIEDDIDAAVRYVIEQGWVDGKRACIVGASYGGYSALMSSIRFPTRYLCAATFAGVTDVTLLFTGDAPRLDPGLRRQLVQRAGDPDLDFDELKRRSPVYRVTEIPVPLFIAHGTADPIVDMEHAHRLRQMLDLHHKPYEWQIIEGAGHGFATVAQAEEWCARLARFLDRHLEEGAR